MGGERTRIILEDQGFYVGVINQRLETSGSRGGLRTEWVDAGGGGDFFDLTPEEKEILEKHGSPVIVYPGGRIEAVKQNLS